MAKSTKKSLGASSTNDVYIVLTCPSPEIKAEILDAFSEEFDNQQAEGTIPEEMTKEQFAIGKIGEVLLVKIESKRIRKARSEARLGAVDVMKTAGSKVKEELKDVKII